jgi:hypothetical protein
MSKSPRLPPDQLAAMRMLRDRLDIILQEHDIPMTAQPLTVEEALEAMSTDLNDLSKELETKDLLNIPVGELHLNPQTVEEIHPNIRRYLQIITAKIHEERVLTLTGGSVK